VSYILDALRKSDLQRQHGAAPTLQTTPLRSSASGRPAAWIYGVLGITLIAAGIAIGWWRPWQTRQPAPVADPSATQPFAAEPPQIPAPQPVPAKSVLTPETPAPASANTQPRTASPSATASARAAVRSVEVPPANAVRPATAVPESKVLAISELPPAIQQEIPPLSISVHAYSSNPPDRIVGINNQILREGGNVPPGLTLDEITPDGIVFSYKGYRFRRGLSAGESR
jgi:general secretion pathway protein B